MANNNQCQTGCECCGKPEEERFLLDVDGVGILCTRCYDDGPPHYKYLRQMLKNHMPPYIAIKVAAFAYLPCALTELAWKDEEKIECGSCDESWLGWYYYRCNTIK